jgi:hypothetical protein
MPTVLFPLTLLFAFTAASQSLTRGASFLQDYAAKDGPTSLVSNPAALGRCSKFSLILHGGDHFMLVPHLIMSANLPVSAGTFSGTIGYRGNNYHSETEATLAYGRNLSKTILAGVGFGCNQSQIPDYIKGTEGSVCAGILIRLSESLVTGMDMRKRIPISTDEELSTGAYHAGAGYTVSELLLIGLQFEKEDERPASFLGALEYSFMKEMFASLGFSTGSDSWVFGSGIHLGSYMVEVKLSKHPFLGWSPSILLVFRQKKKENEIR